MKCELEGALKRELLLWLYFQSPATFGTTVVHYSGRLLVVA